MAKKAKNKREEKPEVIRETLPAVVVPPKKELVLEGDPDAQLAYASKAAKALMSVVSKKPKPVMINGKQYLEYGDWQVLARFYGATVEIEWTQKIVDDKQNLLGYEARALVKRNGEVISSAEGMCLKEEKRWKTADEYAIRSMAQTRTAAKALRNAFGWVAELAGYSATPAEEMPYEQSRPTVAYTVPESDNRKKSKIIFLMEKLGLPHSSKEASEESVKEATGLDLDPKNYDAIITKLEEKVLKDPMANISFSEEKDN